MGEKEYSIPTARCYMGEYHDLIRIKILSSSDSSIYGLEKKVNKLLSKGWKIHYICNSDNAHPTLHTEDGKPKIFQNSGLELLVLLGKEM